MKKHPAETNGTDLKFTESDLGYAMKHLKGWMADQYVKTVSLYVFSVYLFLRLMLVNFSCCGSYFIVSSAMYNFLELIS